MKYLPIILALLASPAMAGQSQEVRAARAALKDAQKKDKARNAQEKLAKAQESVKRAEEILQDKKDRLAELNAQAAAK
jgi:hypothetical protein